MRNAVLTPEERVPLEAIDLFDPERFRSGTQHLSWRTLRQEAPVWPQTGPQGARFWSVTRYHDVLRVIKDHRTFSSEYGTILAVLGGDLAGGHTINLMDPPRHGAVRVPTMKLLSTGALLRHSEAVRARVRELIAPLRAGGVHDLAKLLLPLPLVAVGDIIGIPDDRWADVPRWTMAGVAPEDPAFAMGSAEETLQVAHYELFALFDELIDERRRRPRQDVISSLLELEMEGRRLTRKEVTLNCYSFIMGANTTTPHAASHLLLAFAERPHLWRELRPDPERIAGAMEEGLRWATPTNHLVRRTSQAVTIVDTRIDRGELVCAWIGSANRDERVFERPYEFDPRRSPNPHLALGNGIHFCNGGPAARLVLAILLEELREVVERFEVAGEVRHLYSNFINGITSLPLAVEVPARPARARPVAATRPVAASSPWFLREIPADAECLLFGFPYTGTGASSYHEWPSRIGRWSVIPLQPPGRESRFRERAHQSHRAFADDLAASLAEHLAGRPYALAAHCGAAPYALETVWRLQRIGAPPPVRLLVSSWGAPHVRLYGRLNQVDLDTFDAVAEVTSMAEQIGRPVPADLAELAAEILREDLRIQRGYRYDPSEPLPCAVTVIGWSRDHVVPEAEVHPGWDDCGEVRHRSLDGEHRDFLRCPAVLQRLILEDLPG
jgi:cytochrome P450/surfactin synthase thioesterase subunit